MRIELRLEIVQFDLLDRSFELQRGIVSFKIVIDKIKHAPEEKDDRVYERKAEYISEIKCHFARVKAKGQGDRQSQEIHDESQNKDTDDHPRYKQRHSSF